MKAKRGRPSAYTEELAAEICSRLASGESLKSICRDAHMPDDHRVREWARDDRAGFSPRNAGYERWADELVEISDADHWMASPTTPSCRNTVRPIRGDGCCRRCAARRRPGHH